MSSKSQKKQLARREDEIESARLFGKHVSKQKGTVLLALTIAVCLLPVILGVRLWDRIPGIIPTGLTLPSGADDSLPRPMAVYGLPGLVAVLDLICHLQLKFNQEKMTLPRAPVRLMGRFGFPIVSIFFCSFVLLRAAGEKLAMPFVTPCAIGLALMMLGAHMWECPRDAQLALRFSFTEGADSWDAVHRFAGWVWLAAGFAILAVTMLGSAGGVIVAVVTAAALALPFLYGTLRSRSLR